MKASRAQSTNGALVPATRAYRANLKDLLDDAAEALWTFGHLQRARELFASAYEAAESVGDNDAMALAAIGLGGIWVHENRLSIVDAQVQARQRQALRRIAPESALAQRLVTRLAAESDYRVGNYETTLAMLSEAMKSDEAVTRAEALSLAHHCLLAPGHSAIRHQVVKDLMVEGLRTGRRTDVLLGLLYESVNHLLDGHPHTDRRLRELRAALNEGTHLAIGYVADAIDVMHAIRAGRFHHAESAAAACAESGRRVGDSDALGWHGAHIVSIRWYQGRITELLSALLEMVASPTLSATDYFLYAALAMAAATAGDRHLAASTLAKLSCEDLSQLPQSSTWLVTLYGIVETAYLLNDADLARSAYELLLPFRDRPMMASLGITCFGSTEYALGMAVLATGDPPASVAHFRRAVHDNQALGHLPATVLSRARLAQALKMSPIDDPSEAPAEIAKAREVAEAVGMPLPSFVLHGLLAGASPRKPEPATCQRVGRRWLVEYAGRATSVGHYVGMIYLALLLANPGHEIASIELAAGHADRDPAIRTRAQMQQPILDETAMRLYRRRIAVLESELTRFDAIGDAEQAKAAAFERDWLLSELSAATGLGRRARAFSTTEERARISVGKALRRAVERIEAVEPGIGRHLRLSISTGRLCTYIPADASRVVD